MLASNETPGFGNQIKFDYFRDQFKGAPTEGLRLEASGDNTKTDDAEIIAISGATISSEAVVDIISNAITQIKEQIKPKRTNGR